MLTPGRGDLYCPGLICAVLIKYSKKKQLIEKKGGVTFLLLLFVCWFVCLAYSFRLESIMMQKSRQ